MIELRHLRALRAITHQPSLTAAARTLHCTQSAISHLITDLERQVGILLVDRSRRPHGLTAAGRRLADCAQAVLPLIDQAEDEVRRIARGAAGRLLISLECHSCIEWLAPALDAYRRQQPQIEIDVRLGASFDPLPALRDGAIDLVITAERTAAAGVLGDPLFRYDLVAVVPAHGALAQRAWLEPSDFAGATVITYPVPECRLDLYTRFLEPSGVVPARRRTAELTTMILQWVASGVGLAVLPSWALARDGRQVVALPLGRRGLAADLFALRRAVDHGAPHLDAFIATARRASLATLPGVQAVPRQRR
jgi:LysR family transcriptional regulator for metE and metH